jgi:type I restriction enzyme R subunit
MARWARGYWRDAKLSAGRTFNKDQQNWLGRIREHLIQNLSIDQADFDEIPILSDAGGWGKANRVFEEELKEMILDLNEALAA